MLLTLFFAVLFAVSLLYDHLRTISEYGDPIASWLFGIVFVLVLFAIPLSNYTSRIGVVEYEMKKSTISEQREALNSDYERVMLTKEIINENAWLVNMQQHKKNLFLNWFVHESVLDLKPIK